jgi:hypothetical protein
MRIRRIRSAVPGSGWFREHAIKKEKSFSEMKAGCEATTEEKRAEESKNPPKWPCWGTALGDGLEHE